MPNEEIAEARNNAQSVTRQVVKGGAWVAASGYWTIGFGFIANIFLTRILSADDFGGFALAMFFAQLYRVQSRLGLGKAYMQHPATDDAAVGTLLGLETLGTLTSIVVGLLALHVLPLLGYTQPTSQVALAILLSLIFESWSNTATTILDKALRFRQNSWLDALLFPLSYIPTFWLAFRGAGIWSLVAQSATYNMLACAGKWWLAKRHLTQTLRHKLHFDIHLARHFLSFGLSVGGVELLDTLASRLDAWMIGTFLSETILGYYDRAFRMAQWPILLFSNLIHRIAFVTYARHHGKQERFEAIARQMTWVFTLVSVPLALVLALTAEELIALLYGPKWTDSVPYLQILAIASVARILWLNANALYMALGKPGSMVTWGTIQLVAMLGLGIPATLLINAQGTALALSAAVIITTTVIYAHLSRKHNLKIGQEILPHIAYSAVVWLVFKGISPMLQMPQLYLRLAIKTGLIGGLYAVLLLVFNGKVTLLRLHTLVQVIIKKPQA